MKKKKIQIVIIPDKNKDKVFNIKTSSLIFDEGIIEHLIKVQWRKGFLNSNIPTIYTIINRKKISLLDFIISSYDIDILTNTYPYQTNGNSNDYRISNISFKEIPIRYGISFQHNKFIAQIFLNNITRYIGRFTTEKEAKIAYDSVCSYYFPNKSRNYPNNITIPISIEEAIAKYSKV